MRSVSPDPEPRPGEEMEVAPAGGPPEGRFCGEAAIPADIALALSLNDGSHRSRHFRRRGDATYIGGGNGTTG